MDGHLKKINGHCKQGDQIGRIFASWATVFVWPFFENLPTEVAQYLKLLFNDNRYICFNFDKKSVGQHFGHFSQTLLVTLNPS
jgi:hypothetical protein